MVLCLPGCLGSKPRGKVSGKVTLSGKPVSMGALTFHGPDGARNTNIDAEGHYEILDAPVGEIVVTVQSGGAGPLSMTPAPKGMEMKPPEGAAAPGANPGTGAVARPTAIPRKYGEVSTSPIKFIVEPGEQVHDIQLTP
jgi:hypothetical protein